MDISLGEDILEILFCAEKDGKKHVNRQDLANVSGITSYDLNMIITGLMANGDITLVDDTYVILTDTGRITGDKINRRHKVLECFLSEMLGMPIESASEQACVIEHKASDETIDLLDTYLTKGPHWCCYNQRTSESDPIICNTIGTFEEGDQVRINLIKGCGRARRLMDMGILPGETVIIKRKLGDNKSLVIEVKDVEICLSPEIASVILGEKIK